VILPKASLSGRSTFLKLGARAYLVISIAAVAVRLAMRENVIADAAVAVGSCGPVATRLPVVEGLLVGLTPAEAAAAVWDEDVFAALRPIEDIRATADYRREAAANLIRRAVTSLAMEVA
jgi:CO/xanthine dehydrogenase FAD-binding subunit